MVWWALTIDSFVRDGYVAVRDAFDAARTAACQVMIWESLGRQSVREDDPATWPPVVEIGSLSGEPFVAAGTSPALTAACDELIGPGRWTAQADVGGAEPTLQHVTASPGRIGLIARAALVLVLFEHKMIK